MSFGISFPKKTRAALPASTATYLAVFGLLLCALLLRLVGLDRYVTPDEPVWVHRAIQFRDALIARNWAKVPVTGHPGVTTMWLGAAGISARQLLTPAESAQHLDWIRPMTWLAPGNGAAYRHLWYFLPSGRIAVALVTTAGLGLSYLMAGRLLGSRLAILALGLLAFDPFLAGHSGLLHTDGLLATFSMLALLAAACALRARAPLGWWAVAGLFAGLTVLTKSPGILVALAVLAGAGLGSLVFALPPRQADLAAGVQGTRLTLGERLARS
ncbi:MAG: hypothetical protein GX601_02590, partial [Anaerolineales bacterium]|nr:hypothetical protein [Anaerolineales bacterium]